MAVVLLSVKNNNPPSSKCNDFSNPKLSSSRVSPSFDYKWKLGIHPLFKTLVFVAFNFVVYFPAFREWKLYFVIVESFFCLLVGVNGRLIKGFMKFLAVNFLGLFVLFYFAEGTWMGALISFGNYALTILALSLG